MNIGIIITVRNNSYRFQNKAIQPYGPDFTNIGFQISRARKLHRTARPIIIATTEQPEDDIFRDYLAEDVTIVHRNPPTDVWSRHNIAFAELDYALMIDGDYPLFDIKMANKLIESITLKPGFDIYHVDSPEISIDGIGSKVYAKSFLAKCKRILDVHAHKDKMAEHYWILEDHNPQYFKKKVIPFPGDPTVTPVKMSIDYPLEMAIQNLIIKWVGHYPTQEEYLQAYKEIKHVGVLHDSHG